MDPVQRKAMLTNNQVYLDSLKGVRIVGCNVRSLSRKKLIDVKLSLDCEILCICESWALDGTDNALFYWDGKSIFRNDRTTGTGGGLLTYVSDSFSPYCNVDEGLQIMHTSIEVQALVFEKPTYKNFIVLNVYRPPSGDVDIFILKLKEIIKKVDRTRFELWLTGDTNLNTRDRNNYGTKELFDLCRETSLKRLIEGITRPNEHDNGGTCLDHIITDCEIVSHSGILDCLIADHKAVFACRKKPRETNDPVSFKGRSYRKYDQDDLREFLIHLNWLDFNGTSDPEIQWCFIFNALIEYLDTTCPIREFTIKKTRDPWVTPETVELINDRQYCLAESRLTNNRDLLRAAGRMRNQIQRQLENSQNTYVLSVLEKCEGDPIKFWREINALVNPVSKNLTIQLENELTGEKIAIEDTAEYINTYFANIGHDLFSKLPVSGIIIPDPVFDDDEEELDIDDLIDHDHVLSLIKKININKSCGLPGINSRVLKDALMFLSHELTIIFKNSIKEGIFPESWSSGLLVPIPKKGNLKSIKNWRPITLLPLPGKLLEKIIHKVLSSHLENNAILNDSQFGFRPNRGTSDAIFNVLKDLYDARDDGKVTIACYIDFCKAFDSVHHLTLIHKICQLNVHSKIKKWLMEYLAHRSHSTIANGKVSNQSNVSFGVPQGSILGPLLFVLFINDLGDQIQNCRYTMYADDVVLYASHKNSREALVLLQDDLDRVGQWCQNNYMTVNTTKSMVMYFGSNTKLAGLDNPRLFLNDSALPSCATYPYLGVELDSKLSLTPHIRKLKKSLGNKIYKISKLRKNMSLAITIKVYKVMILPSIEYCSFYTGSAHSAELIKLQRLQNHALRICTRTGIRNRSVNDLHTECNVDMLERRRKIQLLQIMWKKAHGGEALEQREVRTRGDVKIKFAKRRANTSFYQKSPYYRGVTLWDKLDNTVQKSTTKRRFKHAVEHLPLDRY